MDPLTKDEFPSLIAEEEVAKKLFRSDILQNITFDYPSIAKERALINTIQYDQPNTFLIPTAPEVLKKYKLSASVHNQMWNYFHQYVVSTFRYDVLNKMLHTPIGEGGDQGRTNEYWTVRYVNTEADIHEIFVATQCNKLKGIVSNFPFCYDYFPAGLETGVAWSVTGKDAWYYSCFESLLGPTLYDMIIGNMDNKLVNGLINQIITALIVAYEELGFVHHQLTPHDIVLYELDNGSYHPLIVNLKKASVAGDDGALYHPSSTTLLTVGQSIIHFLLSMASVLKKYNKYINVVKGVRRTIGGLIEREINDYEWNGILNRMRYEDGVFNIPQLRFFEFDLEELKYMVKQDITIDEQVPAILTTELDFENPVNIGLDDIYRLLLIGSAGQKERFKSLWADKYKGLWFQEIDSLILGIQAKQLDEITMDNVHVVILELCTLMDFAYRLYHFMTLGHSVFSINYTESSKGGFTLNIPGAAPIVTKGSSDTLSKYRNALQSLELNVEKWIQFYEQNISNETLVYEDEETGYMLPLPKENVDRYYEIGDGKYAPVTEGVNIPFPVYYYKDNEGNFYRLPKRDVPTQLRTNIIAINLNPQVQSILNGLYRVAKNYLYDNLSQCF